MTAERQQWFEIKYITQLFWFKVVLEYHALWRHKTKYRFKCARFMRPQSTCCQGNLFNNDFQIIFATRTCPSWTTLQFDYSRSCPALSYYAPGFDGKLGFQSFKTIRWSSLGKYLSVTEISALEYINSDYSTRIVENYLSTRFRVLEWLRAALILSTAWNP